MPQCSQCDRPALLSVGGQNLCVHCNAILQDSVYKQQVMNVAMMNLAMDEMDAAVGFPGSSPRIELPQTSTIIHGGDMNIHNINVTDSVVGAINTGNVKTIDVSIDHLKQSNNEDVAEALRQMTEAILGEPSLNDSGKNEMIDQITYLATQAQIGEQDRQKGTIKAVFGNLKEAVGAFHTLNDVWGLVKPVLSAFFGVG
jgi:hypothetical protein